MKKYTFIIHGNQEDPDGNPLPYHRTTQGGHWDKGARRYAAWKDYVRAELERGGGPGFSFDSNPIVLDKDEFAEVTISVEWKNNTHGDLDNVLKGINDALFENDKNITKINAISKMSKDKKGLVEVQITIK